MKWFTDAHWIARTGAASVGLAFLISCSGFTGPVLADVRLVELLCGPGPTPMSNVITLLIEVPQFVLFVYGTTVFGQWLVGAASPAPRLSLRSMLQLVCAFCIFTFVMLNEWYTYEGRRSSELSGWVDYISPVWLIEGPFMTNVVLSIGLFCGAFGLVRLVWDRLDRKTTTQLMGSRQFDSCEAMTEA